MLQAANALSLIAAGVELGSSVLTISLQTCFPICFALDGVMFVQSLTSFAFRLLESWLAELMRFLQAATAACTAGLLEALVPPLLLVPVAPAAEVEPAGVDEPDGVELLPQPAANPPIELATRASNSVLLINGPSLS